TFKIFSAAYKRKFKLRAELEEKITQYGETLVENSAQDGMYVLVTVEPEGVVALPNVQERKEVIFNIEQHFELLAWKCDAIFSPFRRVSLKFQKHEQRSCYDLSLASSS
ncbi:hypothetical protein C3L33_14560, partial [Rhododendron williamsianum]